MPKSVATQVAESSSSGVILPMQNGTFNPSFFRHLQRDYQTRTGYNLVLSDVNGSIQMGLPDCEKFPCMRSCRECRETVVSEALRTGKVCVDACHEGYALWGLPLAVEGRIIGGMIVIGVQKDLTDDKERFTRACTDLYHLMLKHGLLPAEQASRELNLTEIHRFIHREAFERLSQVFERSGKPFLDCLQTADFEEAKGHFARIRHALADQGELPLDLVRGIVGDLIFRARRQFCEAGMDAYACYSEAGMLLETISKAKTPRQVEASLEAFLERFIVLSRQRPKDPDDLLIQKATTYLEQHVHEVLTRESVARAVGISPSHFSRLIREKKGRTFTDLLNQYRIERACKLLVRSSHTLAEIASEAGFCDQSYFSKVFRRYKEMTPARYREQHQL